MQTELAAHLRNWFISIDLDVANTEADRPSKLPPNTRAASTLSGLFVIL